METDPHCDHLSTDRETNVCTNKFFSLYYAKRFVGHQVQAATARQVN